MAKIRSGDGAELIHFCEFDTSIIMRMNGSLVPEVIYWGKRLNLSDETQLEGFSPEIINPPLPIAVLDEPIHNSILPTRSYGFRGQAGVSGHREFGDFSPKFEVTHFSNSEKELTIILEDSSAKLRVNTSFRFTLEGLLIVKSSLKNLSDGTFHLNNLSQTLPLPMRAKEILDFTGTWCKERTPQRHPFSYGRFSRDSRRGRTGHDATLLILVGTSGFSNETGEIWASHIGWSGDHSTFVEKFSDGHQTIGASELLESGEVALQSQETYETPEIFFAYSSEGLNGISSKFQNHLRSTKKKERKPRPVIYNSWESMYFDIQEVQLRKLALLAKEIGIERFVIDDGWFKGRRNAEIGLGDWYVDETVFRNGLDPFIEFLANQGIDFGLWVEPEMVNINSDLFRAHPEWVLRANEDRLPLGGRGGQQTLDLSIPEAFDYIYARLNELLFSHDIKFLKWDMNRDIVDAGHNGKPAIHAQTLALYRLMGQLKTKHPDLEIENCSSGGARIDLGISKITDRAWASDTNDPLERTYIQRWTSLLLPLEMLGNDVSTAESHTTGRTHSFSFRANTAIFGHLGIQLDLLKLSQKDLEDLSEMIFFYKKNRELIHTGKYFVADSDLDSEFMHGVVSIDQDEAIFSYVKERNSANEFPPRITFPGIDSNKDYHVSPVGGVFTPKRSEIQDLGGLKNPFWMQNEGVTIPGVVLKEIGLYMPILNPEQALLISLSRAISQ
jgi:alpha-galactosidase